MFTAYSYPAVASVWCPLIAFVWCASQAYCQTCVLLFSQMFCFIFVFLIPVFSIFSLHCLKSCVKKQSSQEPEKINRRFPIVFRLGIGSSSPFYSHRSLRSSNTIRRAVVRTMKAVALLFVTKVTKPSGYYYTSKTGSDVDTLPDRRTQGNVLTRF